MYILEDIYETRFIQRFVLGSLWIASFFFFCGHQFEEHLSKMKIDINKNIKKTCF